MAKFAEAYELSQYPIDFKQWLAERKPQKDAFEVGDRVFSVRYIPAGIGTITEISESSATVKFANVRSEIPIEDLELEDAS